MWLGKFFNKIKNIKRVKFVLNEKKIVVFDGVCLGDLNYVLSEYNYFVLEDRSYRINEVYLTPLLVLNFFLYFYLIFKNYSLKSIYNIALIKSVKPKIVITSIDNSINFYLSAKILHKKIYFLAIQNSSRHGFRALNYCLKKNTIFPKNYKSLFFIPNLVCFGQDDIDGAKKENLKVKKFYDYGSLRISNFFYYLKENNIKLKKNKFDICLVSEPHGNNNYIYKNDTIENSSIKVAKFTINFCMQNKLNFIFATKFLYASKGFKAELDFLKPHLNKQQLEYLLLNINKKNNIYSSYEALLQSKIAVGWQSTLLFDKIGLHEKILSCNFSNFKPWDFPINGICNLKDKDYQSFVERLNLILSLNNQDYFNKLEKNPNFVMNFDRNESVVEKTKKILKNNI
ncbi:hypothetical protein OAO00_01010 [Pelagibacteraceae bacterium]|nr:hypothetical protein [Pelagibacteraceae bacterium]